jgi:hypothetical protein
MDPMGINHDHHDRLHPERPEKNDGKPWFLTAPPVTEKDTPGLPMSFYVTCPARTLYIPFPDCCCHLGKGVGGHKWPFHERQGAVGGRRQVALHAMKLVLTSNVHRSHRNWKRGMLAPGTQRFNWAPFLNLKLCGRRGRSRASGCPNLNLQSSIYIKIW